MNKMTQEELESIRNGVVVRTRKNPPTVITVKAKDIIIIIKDGTIAIFDGRGTGSNTTITRFTSSKVHTLAIFQSYLNKIEYELDQRYGLYELLKSEQLSLLLIKGGNT